MKTAWVLAGSGLKAILLRGMTQALMDHGFVPDEVHSSSSGSGEAVFLASGQSNELTKFWLTVRTKDVYNLNPLKFLGKQASCMDNTPYYKTLTKMLDFDATRSNKIPHYMVDLDVTTWDDTTTNVCDPNLTNFQIVDTVCKSGAPPCLFPCRDNKVDGGVLLNYSYISSLADNVDRIFWLVPAAKEPAPVNNGIDMLNFTINAMLYAQFLGLQQVLPYLNTKAEIILITFDKPTGVGDINFDNLGTVQQRQGYIDLGYNRAVEVLKEKSLI